MLLRKRPLICAATQEKLECNGRPRSPLQLSAGVSALEISALLWFAHKDAQLRTGSRTLYSSPGTFVDPAFQRPCNVHSDPLGGLPQHNDLLAISFARIPLTAWLSQKYHGTR